MARGPAATESRHLRTLFALGAAGNLTDGQLLERFATRNGDPAELAFAALVDRHGPMVLRAARATLRDEHSARDAFQATFLILARKARSLWVRDSLGPWLLAVARRVALEARSAESRRRRIEGDAARPEAYVPADRPDDDLARVLDEEIGRLPPHYRLAVTACHLEGLTQHEAAARLGWPVGTLQSRLARGRLRLRDRLRRRGLAPSLALLPCKLAPMPPALVASTARAALAVAPGGKLAGLVAPAVLGLLETSTKGMLMTKLKLGAVTLVMACGIVGSGGGLGIGRPVRATDDGAKSAKFEVVKPEVPPISEPQPQLGDGDVVVNPGLVVLGPDADPAIPPPSDGPGFPYLLEFFETQSVGGLEFHQQVARLIRHGYPIKAINVGTIGKDGIAKYRAVGDRYRINIFPTIILVDGAGDEIARFAEPTTPEAIAAFYNDRRPIAVKLADFYNQNRSKPPQQPAKVEAAEEPVLEESPIRRITDFNASGIPIQLLFFTASGPAPDLRAELEVSKLVIRGYAVQTIDIDKDADLAKRHRVASVPTYVVVHTLGGRELARAEGIKPASQLAQLFNEARGNLTSDDVASQPSLAEIQPKPWETVARIKIHLSETEWGFGSGTVIFSSAEESIILTQAHQFRINYRPQPAPRDFRIPITVDLFGGQFVSRQSSAMLACTQKDIPAEVIDFDLTRDVGLIRIRPGRKLPASRVVPASLKPQKGMAMTTVGCSHGNDATAWSTTILDPRVEMTNSATKEPFATIKCAHQPAEGRSGGGLFTTDGYLAGVCDFADPNEHVGLYAVPESIHALLDRNNLSALYREPEADEKAPVVREPSPTARPGDAPKSDRDRLDEMERKLDRVLKALETLKEEGGSGQLKGDSAPGRPARR